MSALQNEEVCRVDSGDKLCPMLAIARYKECTCMGSVCAWWHRRYPHTDGGGCALNAIATSLDEIDADLCT